MLFLYFYRAGNPAHGDFQDLSCRTDPDLDALTFGICRPPLRRRLAARPDIQSSTIVFYTVAPRTPVLLITAVVDVAQIFRTHVLAAGTLPPPYPTNLLTDGNPCRCGTTYTGNVSATKPRTPACDCTYYFGRQNTPYFQFHRRSPASWQKNPVSLPFPELQKLCPAFFRLHSRRQTWPSFQQATSNDCHEISDPREEATLLQRVGAKSQPSHHERGPTALPPRGCRR